MIFVSPCAVVEDVFAIEGVHRHVVLHPALIKHGVPAVIQNLVLMKVTQQKSVQRSGEEYRTGGQIVTQIITIIMINM